MSALSRQTGLSRRYLKTILDGVAVRHPMHREACRRWRKHNVPNAEVVIDEQGGHLPDPNFVTERFG